MLPVIKHLMHYRIATAAMLVALAATLQPSESLQRGLARGENPTRIELTAPIDTWDEAVPLGNGLTGGLLWGKNNTIRLSLDRGDLWDERPAAEKDWWKKHPYAEGKKFVDQKQFDLINKLWDDPYNGVTPTKLPVGRMEIDLDPDKKVQSFALNLATAEGSAQFADGTRLDAFFSATEPVALLRISGPPPLAVRLRSPMDVFRSEKANSAGPSSGGTVADLGYSEAKHGAASTAQWYIQEAAEGLVYCVCTESRRIDHETLIAVAITSTSDSADPLALARKRCSSALGRGYDAMLKPHCEWWRDFWMQSSVHLPDQNIQRHYNLCKYFYGAASRRHAPPMPLQGVWTADCGGLPPWKGDYHNDLNTQMTYLAYLESGNFEEGASYLDFLWQRKPVFEKFAQEFYDTSGLACPGVMSLAGQPLGGWGQYSLSPTMSAWSAHLFYLHWRYTMDEDFLRNRAYPWCAEVGQCMLGLLKPNSEGVLALPLSASPELFDNTDRAWLEPNSNYDLMCLKMLFLSLSEMADACDKPDDAKKWADAAAALGDFHADAGGTLLLDAKTPLPESHRHFSNLMGIYPFNLMTCEGGETDRQRIRASLRQWDAMGTSQWVGYSFSWMSCMRARIGDADSALRNLDIFVKAFILRNGFHANGDQTKSGFSDYTYRPFTLEGNFLAMQAVQEMLLQSWSPTPGKRDTEIIRIFPAMPRQWRDAEFADLRAEGGYRVSARRRNGETIWLKVEASRDGLMRIRDNFNGGVPLWNRPGAAKIGDQWQFPIKAGESLEARFSGFEDGQPK